jgi:hypothetical protein
MQGAGRTDAAEHTCGGHMCFSLRYYVES